MSAVQPKLSILMVASENDALPGAKVGGIGDVIRDVPAALAELGHAVSVVVPSYGYLHDMPGSRLIGRFPVEFAGIVENVSLFQVAASEREDGSLTQWVIDHPRLYPNGAGKVYCDDGADRPFATDANKYAFFCAAVGQAILNDMFGELNVLHLHDWHAATLAVLRAFDSHFSDLQNIRTVYTIHNLALQGVRPFRGDPSSFHKWFPKMLYDQTVICDPRVFHCYNPMRAAINLCDKVHAVSPTYAEEIQHVSQYDQCVYGGEGLEVDIQSVSRKGNLVGILNGCEYPENVSYDKLSATALSKLLDKTLMAWVAKEPALASAHWVAERRIEAWSKKKNKGVLLTSVGRVTEQKVRLLKLEASQGGKSQSVLAHLLDALGNQGYFMMVGSGDADYEQFLVQLSSQYSNFIFMRGYSDALAQALYKNGDLFLMPSSFEPCGISQMLAMRAGQACLVHAVGGLNDTVKDNESGFVFTGENGAQQAEAFLSKFNEVLALIQQDKASFDAVAQRAKNMRFTWQAAAQQYLEQLYQ